MECISGALGAGIDDGDDPFSKATWPVELAIVELARRPHALTVRLDDGGTALTVERVEFEPREGFTIDEESGDLIVADDPRELSYYWYGRAGMDTVALSVTRGYVDGLVWQRHRRHTFFVRSNRQYFREVDMPVLNAGRCVANEIQTRIEQRAEALPTPIPVPTSEAQFDLKPGRDNPLARPRPKYGAQFTVLFYYTDAAASLLDSNYNPVTAPNAADDELASRANGYIDEINQAMRNSGGLAHVGVARNGGFVRAAGSFGDPILENSSGNPVLRFESYLISLLYIERDLANRAAADADVAVLLLRDNGSVTGQLDAPVLLGAAYTQSPNCGFGQAGIPDCSIGTNAYRAWALAAVTLQPGLANYKFSHEVGHMLGNDHDPGNARPLAEQSFSHSFGYRVPGVVRDIMADPPCGSIQADSCPRTLQYSNPDTVFIGAGIPAGVPGGRACPGTQPPCVAAPHAALTIRKLVENVGNHYPLGSNQAAPDVFWDGFEL